MMGCDFNKAARTGRSVGQYMTPMVLAVWGALAMAGDADWDQGHNRYEPTDDSEPGPCEQSQCQGCEKSTGSPVFVSTGHLLWQESIASVPGQPRLELTLTYNSHDPRDGIFGNGWSSGCEARLIRTANRTDGEDQVILREGDGQRYRYQRSADGDGFQAPPGVNNELEYVDGDGSGVARLESGSGMKRWFDASGRLVRREQPNGRFIAYNYSDQGQLTKIEASGGRYFRLSYNNAGRVSKLTDQAGRSWQFGYDAKGNLTRVTNPTGGVRRFDYQDYQPPGDAHVYQQLTEVTDAAGVTDLAVSYNGEQVARYTEGANTFEYSYDDGAQQLTKTDSTGARWQYRYNDQGLIVSETNPAGETTHYDYDDEGNRISRTDPKGNEWRFEYDERNRQVSLTNPLGNTSKREYGDQGVVYADIAVTGQFTPMSQNREVSQYSGQTDKAEDSIVRADEGGLERRGKSTVDVSARSVSADLNAELLSTIESTLGGGRV